MPKLVYFPSLRGRAEVIRLAAAEAGLKFEEETFTDFPALKASGRLPFQAVPMWEEDDGLKLVQSNAILQHIGRAHGLYGSSPREAALVDQALWTAEDIRNEYRKIQTAEPAKRADVRAELISKHLPRFFSGLERLLAAAGTPYFAGQNVSVGDLALWYALELGRDNGFGALLADLPKLNAWYDRVAARPKIAEYVKSPARHPVFKLPA
ncbi:MAG: glutathione S-transferase [Myxococcaceae bacterium]|nr:glutathione S-transferase [Myxococcaceae bacterium]